MSFPNSPFNETRKRNTNVKKVRDILEVLFGIY